MFSLTRACRYLALSAAASTGAALCAVHLAAGDLCDRTDGRMQTRGVAGSEASNSVYGTEERRHETFVERMRSIHRRLSWRHGTSHKHFMYWDCPPYWLPNYGYHETSWRRAECICPPMTPHLPVCQMQPLPAENGPFEHLPEPAAPQPVPDVSPEVVPEIPPEEDKPKYSPPVRQQKPGTTGVDPDAATLTPDQDWRPTRSSVERASDESQPPIDGTNEAAADGDRETTAELTSADQAQSIHELPAIHASERRRQNEHTFLLPTVRSGNDSASKRRDSRSGASKPILSSAAPVPVRRLVQLTPACPTSSHKIRQLAPLAPMAVAIGPAPQLASQTLSACTDGDEFVCSTANGGIRLGNSIGLAKLLTPADPITTVYSEKPTVVQSAKAASRAQVPAKVKHERTTEQAAADESELVTAGFEQVFHIPSLTEIESADEFVRREPNGALRLCGLASQHSCEIDSPTPARLRIAQNAKPIAQDSSQDTRPPGIVYLDDFEAGESLP